MSAEAPPPSVQDPESPEDIYLDPGGFHFGGGNVRLRTVLGSCIAITLWHPEKRIGGMCHYLLPRRPVGARGASGFYGEEAMSLFLRHVERCGCRPVEFRPLLIGGGRMFREGPFSVAQANIDAGRLLLRENGFPSPAEHVGGAGHRQVIMELWSGRVVVTHHGPAAGGG
jgi:chemotaxis protein CheD